MRAIVVALVAAYLSGEISFAEFKAWFIPVTWNMLRMSDEAFANTVRTVQLLVMECSAGDRTEAELKTHLRSLVPWSQPAIVADLIDRSEQRLVVKATRSEAERSERRLVEVG